MGNFKIKSIWENKNTGGGNVPADLEQRVQTLENEVVKKTGDQSIGGNKTFTNKITANEGLTTTAGKSITSGDLELGYGAGVAYITPEDNGGKVLKFGGKSGKGRFNLDLENQSRLMGVADPTANFHAANKQYVDNLNNQNAKLAQDNTFTGANTFNNQVSINSAGNDFTWETTRNWNQNVDNTVARTKDFKYARIFEKTQATSIGDTWNTDLSWTIQDINTDGLHEFLIIVSIDNVAYSLNGKVVWKNGLGESKSQFLTISNGASEISFQLVIKGANNFRIYHKKSGSAVSLQWIRGWIVRAGNQPWKMNQLW